MKPDYTNTTAYKLWITALAASVVMLVYKAMPSIESCLFLISFMALIYLTLQDINKR